jgi:hypothetical protein
VATTVLPFDVGVAGGIHKGVVTLAEAGLAACGGVELELGVAEAHGQAFERLVVVGFFGLAVIDLDKDRGGAALLADFLGGEEGAAAGLTGLSPVAVEVDVHGVEVPVLRRAGGGAAAGGEAVADEVVAGGDLPALRTPVDDDLAEGAMAGVLEAGGIEGVASQWAEAHLCKHA